MFKLIGALLGYMVWSFPGAILGYFIGSSVDRSRSYGLGGVNPFSHGERQAVFIETVFCLMGKLAKADGQITKDEIDHTENFIKQMGMSAEHREVAINYFRQGSADSFDTQEQLRKFTSTCGLTNNLPQMLMLYLIIMSVADGHLDSSEEIFLKQTAEQLGFSSADFQQLLEMTLNQTHFGGGSAQRPTSASAIEDAYKALGVTKENTDKEVKRAYRKLMSKYHPDKLIGQGLPEDMIAVATEQAKEIQAAYDLIERSRK
ncbi:MAG: co-chaperone DjlA [Gammaproteobacteria bacterium]